MSKSARVIDPERSRRGFTLVELLVVIAIIAILSVIGFTVFTNVQKGARDAKRRVDIEAISKALEVNKTSSGYQTLNPAWFSGAAIPYDPKATGPTDGTNLGCGYAASTDGNQYGCYYCLKLSSTPSYCAWGDPYLDSSSSGFNNVPSWPTSWVICANLESSSAYYCRGSQQ